MPKRYVKFNECQKVTDSSMGTLRFLEFFSKCTPKKKVGKETNLSNISEPLEGLLHRHLLGRGRKSIWQCGCLNTLHNLPQAVRKS